MSGRGSIAYEWAVDATRIAERSGDPSARLAALAGLSVTTAFTSRSGFKGADVRTLYKDVTDLAEQLGEWWLLGLSAGFAGLGVGTFDPEAGRALRRRGLAAAARSGSPYAIGAASLAEGRALGHEGETDAAAASFAVAIQRFMEIGDERFVLASRSDLAHALRRGGRFDEALAMYRETIPGWMHLGHRGAVANSSRTSRTSSWAARRTIRRFASSARRTRSARPPMPAWPSTRSRSTRHHSIVLALRWRKPHSRTRGPPAAGCPSKRPWRWRWPPDRRSGGSPR